MKRLLALALFFGLCFPVFSFEPGELEKRIIAARPAEMIAIVEDRSLEAELARIYRRYDEISTDGMQELTDAYMNVFPGSTEEDCMLILFKLGLVISLGSGEQETVYMGIEMLMFCRQIDDMSGMGELPGEFKSVIQSPFWIDCVEFSRLFDAGSFLAQRYPEDFMEE